MVLAADQQAPRNRAGRPGTPTGALVPSDSHPDSRFRGHALSALTATAPDLGGDSIRAGTSLHQHRPSGRRAPRVASPGVGTAAVAARTAAAAALPTVLSPGGVPGEPPARPVSTFDPQVALVCVACGRRPDFKEVTR